MSPTAVICPVHGPFSSRGFDFHSSRNVMFSNVGETCPKCGLVGNVMDGTYNYDAHGIAEALTAPQWSIDALRELQRDLVRAEQSLSSPKTAEDSTDAVVARLLAEIEKRDQRLVDEIVKETKGKSRNKVLAFVRALLEVVGGVVLLREGGEYGVEAVRFVVEKVFGG